MNENRELYNESYVLYDRVMNPLTAQQERKTRKDLGTRRGRHSTSSSSAFDQPSSSHLNDDDGNDEGTSCASTPFPIRYVNSLTNEGVTSVIFGTIIVIHEEEGWWYVGCRSCKKKVIREKDMIDLETDIPKKSAFGKDDWWCTKCNVVQDESGAMSLTLWNDEVQAVVDRYAYQLCDKYANYAFKVSIDEYNLKKLLPVFTVLRLSDDPEILDSIRLAVTPSKMDTEATSSALPNITWLDLESQTDKNTTPISTQKKNVVDHVEQEDASDGKNKRAAENDIGNESSNGKKMAIEVKTEKDA
ncbi:replication protein A 70 kDa DNA-binding subunit B [Tanacetum coccineum]